MRGTRRAFPRCRLRRGIIPAYAGNTTGRIRREYSARDHPRVCGEHTLGGQNMPTKPGSSPRMRGTPSFVREHCGVWGIIPAYAGNTDADACASACLWDHPRVCGEHSVQIVHGCAVEGSSPRMRGTRGMITFQSYRTGIIPAYAGNTPPLSPQD